MKKNPTPNEFNFLTESVGWGTNEDKLIKEALNNSLYSLCIYDDDKIIGHGRIIGDKTMFLYIQDVMIIPDYQNKKIGSMLMNKLLEKVEEYRKVSPNIRVNLGSVKGKEGFYEKFGFVKRPNCDVGSGMMLKK